VTTAILSASWCKMMGSMVDLYCAWSPMRYAMPVLDRWIGRLLHDSVAPAV